MNDIPDPPPSNAPTEREKWEADQGHRTEELALKKRELEIRETEAKRGRYTNPMMLAIAGAIVTVVVSFIANVTNGYFQRQLEAQKSEAQLILEVVKTADPVKAATNLSFLVSTNLIKDREVKEAVQNYVKNTPSDKAVSLPIPTGASTSSNRSAPSVVCLIKGSTDINAAKAAVSSSPQALRTTWSRETATEADGTTEFESSGVSGSIEHLLRVDNKDIRVRVTLRLSDSILMLAELSGRPLTSSLRSEVTSSLEKLGKPVTCSPSAAGRGQ